MSGARRRLASALLALAAATGAQAQTVYRCGNEYSRVPCGNGGAAIETTGSATASARADAERTALRERQLGERMEADRLRAERAQKPALAASLGPRQASAAPGASASLKPKKKAKAKIRVVDGDDFIARVPRAKAK